MKTPAATSNATSAPLIRDALADNLAFQFRTTRDLSLVDASVDKTGFSELDMSASSQFSELGWREIRKHFTDVEDDRFFVVDLRQESHGFLNGNAVSWYATRNWANVALAPNEAISVEEAKLRTLDASEVIEIALGHEVRDRKGVPASELVGARSSGAETADSESYCAASIDPRVCPTKNGRISRNKSTTALATISWQKSSVASERALVSPCRYARFPVSDHLRPSDEMLDEFIGFVRALREGVHLHFHCHGGDGRTTSFMTFYDMLRNASRASCDAIITRNRQLSSYCLCHIQNDFHRPYAVERWELVTLFHEYARAEGLHGRSWSEWVHERSASSTSA